MRGSSKGTRHRVPAIRLDDLVSITWVAPQSSTRPSGALTAQSAPTGAVSSDSPYHTAKEFTSFLTTASTSDSCHMALLHQDLQSCNSLASTEDTFLIFLLQAFAVTASRCCCLRGSLSDSMTLENLRIVKTVRSCFYRHFTPASTSGNLL